MSIQDKETKKAYEPPRAEAVALNEAALDAVSGGSEKESMGSKHLLAETGYPGGERGGGCDEAAYHRNARTHSPGRNKMCS